MSDFSNFSLKKKTQDFIKFNDFKKPTPIQEMVIPAVLRHRSVIGISETGSGKTHSFLIPIFNQIDTAINQVQVVISAPTRELALQLYVRCQQMQSIDNEISIRLITGGMDKEKMMGQLKNQPHIVVGTPGRLKDLFLNENTLQLQTARTFVVDEADMTLEFGFLEDIDQILNKLDRNIQLLSFSATIPVGLRRFFKKYMNSPIIYENKNKTSANIEHVLIPCKHKSYCEKLIEVLKGFTPYVCLIFANTKNQAQEVANALRDENYKVLELHANLPPRQRMMAMKQLMNLQETYVVASDVVARGIDIEGVSHVVSLGFPNEIHFYLHRAGRTGRVDREGICYSLYQEKDIPNIQQLQNKKINFIHRDCKNGVWSDLKPLGYRRSKKLSDEERQIIAQIKGRKTRVKPGYKKKQKQLIESLKRKKRREMIRGKIQEAKKQRAKEKMRGES